MKTAFLVLAVLIAGFGVVVATRPSTLHVERSAAVKAPARVVYPLIADFHRWKSWSPWEKRDPAMQKTYSGPESGVGAGYAWKGNKDVGEGSMVITDAKPPEELHLKLDFFAPMKATNVTTFRLTEHAGTTIVVWSMDGESNFVAKAFGMFVDMDKMIGADFEAGLTAMTAQARADKVKADAAAAEAAAKAAAQPVPAPTEAGPDL